MQTMADRDGVIWFDGELIRKDGLFVPDDLQGLNFRITGFFDIGNVFGPGQGFTFGELRYSTGVSAVWISPLGPLTLSLAAPLNKDDQDETQPIQFTFGTSF